MTEFNGKYKLDKSDNFDEFMQALGVNYALRKIGATTKPTLTVSTEDGKHFVFSSESTFRNIKVEFTLGEEYEDTSPDGRKTKNVVTIENSKMTQQEKSRDGSGKEVTYVRELTADRDLQVTCTVGDVTCTRLYKRL